MWMVHIFFPNVVAVVAPLQPQTQCLANSSHTHTYALGNSNAWWIVKTHVCFFLNSVFKSRGTIHTKQLQFAAAQFNTKRLCNVGQQPVISKRKKHQPRMCFRTQWQLGGFAVFCPLHVIKQFRTWIKCEAGAMYWLHAPAEQGPGPLASNFIFTVLSTQPIIMLLTMVHHDAIPFIPRIFVVVKNS